MMMTTLCDLPPPFPNVVEALVYWADRDRTPLRGAVVPPCDVLGDAQLRTVAAEHRIEADANIARIGRMVAVLRKWGAEIADAAAQAAVEGKAA